MSRRKGSTYLAGALTGVFSGFTGVGGGVVLVSMMVSLLGFSQHRAHGSSLAVIIVLGLFGAITYAAQGYHDLGLTLTLGAGSMFGVVAGARLMASLPARLLRRIFGVFLLLVSLNMLLQGIVSVQGLPIDRGLIGMPLWLGLGLISGVLGGFLGIGGAMIMVPVMVLVAGFEQHLAQGISLAVITITSVMGAFAHYKLGNVDVGAAVAMGPAAVATVVLASALAGRVDSFWLTKIFGSAMIGFAFQFIFGTGRRFPPAGASRFSPQPAPAPHASG